MEVARRNSWQDRYRLPVAQAFCLHNGGTVGVDVCLLHRFGYVIDVVS